MPLFGLPNVPAPEPEKKPELTEDLTPAPELTVEEKKLLSWRVDRLMKDGGFPAPAALALANEGVDYREACRLFKASGDLDWTLDQLVL